MEKAIFTKNEYIFFMVGVFILGGLLVIPWLWGFGILLSNIGLRYDFMFLLSFILCFFIFIAFRRNGTISYIRAIPTGFLVIFMVPGIVKEISKKTIPPVSDVLIGIAILIICGRLGILLKKVFTHNDT